jgi:recombination protein RecA
VRRTETIEGGKDADAVGNRVKVKVVKNKVAPPFRKADLEIHFGKGISASASLLDAAVKHEIIDKKGAWFSYGEEKVGQGRESAREYLEQHPEFAAEVEAKLKKKIFPGREFPAAKPAPKAAPPSDAEKTAPSVPPETGNSPGAEAAPAVPAPEPPVTPAAQAPAVEPSAVPPAARTPTAEPPSPGAVKPPPQEPQTEVRRGPGRPRKTAVEAAANPAGPDGLF